MKDEKEWLRISAYVRWKW